MRLPLTRPRENEMTATDTQIKAFLLGVSSEAGRQETSLAARSRDLLDHGYSFSVTHLEFVVEVNAIARIAKWIRLGFDQGRPPMEVLLGCRESALDSLLATEAHTSLVGQAQIAATAAACARFLKKTERLL